MNEKRHKSKFISLIILSIVILSIYSNIFQASWHMDDHPNILNNYFLHLESLTFEDLKKTLYTNIHNPYELKSKMYRPIPCFSFALNWYFGKNDVLGYHAVDITIHILTAYLIFLFINNLFLSPRLKNDISINPVIIAFFACLLWAVNPIHTQAVTYIVQRMAQLAAFFYILGMYTYIRGRLSRIKYKSACWFALTFAIYPLAVYSKSNAAMLPMSILLLEILFFQNLSNKIRLRQLAILVFSIAILIGIFGALLFLKGDPIVYLLKSYGSRSFTITERLLTEPRVIIFYLSQIFYPAPDRFSIAHDISLSTGIFRPWTTLSSILMIAGMIGFSLAKAKKLPILSFAILFFFLNHIIESSIIPLEILFEHRNYLPSFFLFLPISEAIFKGFSQNSQTKRGFNVLLVCLLVVFIIFSSASTYLRNRAWSDSITLWTDAVSKAPNNSRALNTLAIKLAWGDNSTHPKRFDMALKLFEKSLTKHIASKHVKADILGNMALIHFYQMKNYQKAFTLFEDALEVNPNNLKIRKDFASALTTIEKFDSALEQTNILIQKRSKNGSYYNLKGHILLWQKKYADAITCSQKAFQLIPENSPDKPKILINLAAGFSLSGKYEKAEHLLLEMRKDAQNEILIHFLLIENSIKMGQNKKTVKYIERMLTLFDKNQIEFGLKNYIDNPKLPPLSGNLRKPVKNKLTLH